MAHPDASAYPEPEDFAVKRPSYHEKDDGMFEATIEVASFRVSGESATKAGARRAAIYEAKKTYHSYHPSYKVENPYPETFTDRQGMEWRRVPRNKRDRLGDYIFVDERDEEDYVDIETMLMWDVRPVEVTEQAE
jgi:hypothetical protein